MSNKVRNSIISTPFQVLLLGLLMWCYLHLQDLHLSAAGGGIVFFFLATYLGAMSGIRGLGRYLLSAAYVALLIALLNYLAGSATLAPYGAGNSALALTLAFLYFVLQNALVFLPTVAKDRRTANEGERMLIRRAGVATTAGMFVGIMTIGLIVPALSQKWFDVGLPSAWNAYYFSILFAAVFSGTEALFLLRGPSVLRGSSLISTIIELTLAVVVILLMCLLEFLLRRNWVLFSCSAITFVGSTLAFFLVWHNRSDTQPRVAQHAQEGSSPIRSEP